MAIRTNFGQSLELKIRTLRECIERKIDYRILTPKDFERLSGDIFLKLNILLSTTTLKRIWGYIDENVTPRESTLSILAQFIGYHDWADFLSSYLEIYTDQPLRITSLRNIESLPLRRGQQFVLTDEQNKYCRIEYIGNGEFCVLESVNYDFRIHDVFRIRIL